MLTVFLPLFVSIVGVLAYALSANPKVAELGRLAFVVGLFFVVGYWAHEPGTFHLP